MAPPLRKAAATQSPDLWLAGPLTRFGSHLLAHWRVWNSSAGGPAEAIARSLGLFAGQAADVLAEPGRVWSRLDGPRPPARPQRGWRPARSASGAIALFHGWIDNQYQVAQQLGVVSSDPGEVYLRAVERWGPRADAQLNGTYCAIVELPDGSLRLSRSPWGGPPLLYSNDTGRAFVASVPRVLFAGGLDQELNVARFGDNLFYNMNMSDEGWYRGTWRVPQGAIVMLTPGSCRVERWYDPHALAPVGFARDEDYVERAAELVGEAVTKALTIARKPAVALSGGLDSSIVAVEIMRQLPAGQRLSSFTATPHPDWDGTVLPAMFGDERPWVEAYAAMHPQLEPAFLEWPEGGFDDRADEMFAAMGISPRNLANSTFNHAVWGAARKSGCDVMFDAEMGNDGFSNDGRWAYVEYLVSGRWRQLYRTMVARSEDRRPVWRRIAALSVLPLFPRPVRRAIRAIVHPELRDNHRFLALLKPEAIERLGLAERATRGGLFTGEYPRNRTEAIRYAYSSADFEGCEAWQGFEQVHGLTRRDVSAYRPLIEYCLALPTDQYTRDGEDRRLARRLGVGRLPEAQRTNRLYGRHNADWHIRLTRRRAALRAEAEALRDDPLMRELLDIDRMQALLDDWPEQTPMAADIAMPREIGLTRAFMAAKFVRHLTGRNPG